MATETRERERTKQDDSERLTQMQKDLIVQRKARCLRKAVKLYNDGWLPKRDGAEIRRLLEIDGMLVGVEWLLADLEAAAAGQNEIRKVKRYSDKERDEE